MIFLFKSRRYGLRAVRRGIPFKVEVFAVICFTRCEIEGDPASITVVCLVVSASGRALSTESLAARARELELVLGTIQYE